MIYKCPNTSCPEHNKEVKVIKETIKVIDGKINTTTKCSNCGKSMEQLPTNGFPSSGVWKGFKSGV